MDDGSDFLETLDRPGGPFTLCDIEPDESPFAEPLVARGRLATFASDFRREEAQAPGLARDVDFLAGLRLPKYCASGAMDCPMHPFLCERKGGRLPLRAVDVLTALRPRAFRSDFAPDLDATSLPYAGYHPGDGEGRYNDEIHSDFDSQYLFPRPDDERWEIVDDDDGAHGALKRYVAGRRLWYVLFHTSPQRLSPPNADILLSRYAVLLAVGTSPHGDRLVGVLTNQSCHNLCD